jgi:putative phosphoribosyl transferase
VKALAAATRGQGGGPPGGRSRPAATLGATRMHDLPVLRAYLNNGKDATEVTDCSERVRKPMRVATGQKVAGRRPEGWREPLTGRTAVVVDDGIATGSTARAACQVARAHGCL